MQMSMNSVSDRLGRSLTDLRVSVTDRCNFRCRYCMPREHFDQEHRYLPRADILSFEEIARVVSSLAPLGLVKVRLTGGEPLLRSELHQLVAGGRVPAAVFKPACEECSLFEICLPQVTGAPGGAARAAHRLFEI